MKNNDFKCEICNENPFLVYIDIGLNQGGYMKLCEECSISYLSQFKNDERFIKFRLKKFTIQK